MDKLFIIIPAYNEEETIEAVAREWHGVLAQAGEGSRLVIVNDGSRDHTAEKLEALAAELPLLIPLTKPNGGHGAACLFGYNYALENGADYIFQTDSDGQTIPGEFPPFWADREKYDLIIGHRSKRQDGFSRVVVTKTLKAVVRVVIGVGVTDANTPFRLMKAQALRACLEVIPKDFNLPNVIISAYAVKSEMKVKFMPITFRPRQGGKNSINLKKIAKIGAKAVRDFGEIRKNMK